MVVPDHDPNWTGGSVGDCGRRSWSVRLSEKFVAANASFLSKTNGVGLLCSKLQGCKGIKVAEGV